MARRLEMDAATIQLQHEPAREVVRDARGVVIGVIERQRQTGVVVARNAHGIVVGRFDQNGTKTARGRSVSRSNVLSALLLGR